MKEARENDYIFFVYKRNDDKMNASEKIKITSKSTRFSTYLNRKVPAEDINTIKKEKMPGFRFTWNYDKEVNLWSLYKSNNTYFTR